MEEFIGTLPVVVEMITESPNHVVENNEADDDIEDAFSEDGGKTSESISSALATQENKKLRRSKRSKRQPLDSSKKMECQLCQFDTGTANQLHHHYMDEHSKEDLVQTLITVTYPDANVEDSDIDFSAVRSIQKRPAVLHTCPVCQKSIAGKNNLDKHLIRHSSQKPFKCDECKKTFSAKRDLQLHEMRHHSKERPHVCTICQKGFVDKAYLKKHMTFHDQSVAYVCDQCGKSFNNVLGLQKHCKTHSQERPYMCEKCSKCFRVKYDLTVHKRNVHKEGVQIQRNEPDSSTAGLLQ